LRLDFQEPDVGAAAVAAVMKRREQLVILALVLFGVLMGTIKT
jgi:hypothetical protein